MSNKMSIPQVKFKNPIVASAMNGFSANDPMQPPPPLPEDKTIDPQVNPGVAQATAQAVQTGANPGILDKAKSLLGDQNFIGLCERFIEQVTDGKTGLFPSAIAAFNAQKDQVQTDLSKIKPGDQLFYAPDASNQNYGHTSIYVGNGQQIGATNSGITQTDINKWQQNTNQRLLGYISPSQNIPNLNNSHG